MDRSRSQAARRPGIAPRQKAEEPAAERGAGEKPRQCPWCGSTNTVFFKRGLTGPTDERDQYFTCEDCGRLTY